MDSTFREREGCLGALASSEPIVPAPEDRCVQTVGKMVTGTRK